MTLFNSFLEELPLILFTVVAQSAVGFSLLYALNNKTIVYEKQNKKFSAIFLTLTILGMIISVFHLGDPFHAFYMITRLFGFEQNGYHVTSWLPLEIVGLSLMILIGFTIFLKNFKPLIYILPIVGFTMLFAMSNIYGSMAYTINTWDLDLTIVLFFSSAILLGAFAYISFFGKDEKNLSIIIAVIGFSFFVLSLCLYTYHIGNIQIDAMKNIFDMANGYYSSLIMWGILLNAIGLILILLPSSNKNSLLLKLAFLLSLVGVILTRILFYSLIVSHLFLG